MASSQPVFPPVVKPSRPVRRFTLAEANRTLPLVRRIVGDILRAHHELEQLQSRLESGVTARKRDAERELDRQMQRLESLAEELQAIGCELKDVEHGLVDYTARHQGRDIHLCWKFDEESIQFWHETTSGFAGRRPVSEL